MPKGVLPDLGTEKETGLVVEAGVDAGADLAESCLGRRGVECAEGSDGAGQRGSRRWHDLIVVAMHDQGATSVALTSSVKSVSENVLMPS